MTKNEKCHFSRFSEFFRFCIVTLPFFLQNCRIWKTNFCTYFIVTSKLLKLKRHTIPHFKALNKSFWPLAQVLTVGAITFVLLRKMSVYFFPWHTLGVCNQKFMTIYLYQPKIFFFPFQRNVIIFIRLSKLQFINLFENPIFCHFSGFTLFPGSDH